MNVTNHFFLTDSINSQPYWNKRIQDFSKTKNIPKKQKESFYLEFFTSSYLDNKSKIARKLGVPFTEVIFNNPNSPIIDSIAKIYHFTDYQELKRISEGFFHFYRTLGFWDSYWANNYSFLSKEVNQRYAMRCVLTFLTLSYPASYKSYLEQANHSWYILSDQRIENIGFSSISQLVHCALEFCKPGRYIPFPWDPRKIGSKALFWNQPEMYSITDNFKQSVEHFLKNGYSMRHEDFSLLTKIESNVIPIRFLYKSKYSQATKDDKEKTRLIIDEFSKHQIEYPKNIDVCMIESSLKEDCPNRKIDSQKANDYQENLLTIFKTISLIEEKIFEFFPMHESLNDIKLSLEKESQGFQTMILQSEGDRIYPALKGFSEHLVLLYTFIQKSLEENTVLNFHNDRANIEPQHMGNKNVTKISDSEEIDSKDNQKKYEELRAHFIKQSSLLANTLDQNLKLKDQLNTSIPIEQTKKALSKYFTESSLNNLFVQLQKTKGSS